MTGWGDALFELTDAVLSSRGRSPRCQHSASNRSSAVPTAVSTRPSTGPDRRGPPRRCSSITGRRWPLVFAVDASTFARCDAESSPERGFYYSASKHSAGQPIVAGWNYQWICQLPSPPTAGPHRSTGAHPATPRRHHGDHRTGPPPLWAPPGEGKSRCSSSMPATTRSPSVMAWPRLVAMSHAHP